MDGGGNLTEHGGRLDLSEDSAFFLALLDNTHAWRERQVRELRFGSRNHVRVISSYQIDFPPELLDRFPETRRATSANVLIPLTTRAKRQLLNFSLAGPGGSPATLTSRASIAALEAEYLRLLADSSRVSGVLATALDPQLFESICVFTPGLFKGKFLESSGGDTSIAVARYLTSGLGWGVDVVDVRRWRKQTAEVGEILAARLQEPLDETSSSEEILLALTQNPRLPESSHEIDLLIDGYHRGITAADRASDDQFLVALAEYGRRYEVVVEVEVPLLEPARIKIEEDLPLELERRFERRGLRYWVAQEFPLGDSRSVHLEARSEDPNIEVSGYEVENPYRQDATGWLETIRHTREALALYGSEPGRPYFATLWVRLSVARSLMVAAWILSGANLLAIAAVPLVGLNGSIGDRLAILAIPTTIAATFALVREQTALATRLQWLPRLFLALTTIVLWIEVVVGLVVWDGGSSRNGSTDRPTYWQELIGQRFKPSTMDGEGARKWQKMVQEAVDGSEP